jgi:pre-mRNA-splicing helicase BRR2
MVDVISSHGYLKPALLTMELSQMIVQAMWVTQSPLYQLPYIDGDLVADLKKAKVEDIIDFMNMDEELRAKVLRGISESQMAQIADVCNRYPTVEMEFSLDEKQYKDGETAEMTVNIRRPDAEDDEDLKRFAQPVQAQFYPGEKDEQWWVIVGRPKLNKLLAIKKVTNFKAVAETQVKLNFVVKAEGGDQGKIDYKVYLICDSYIGCDQEDEVSVKLV